MTDIFLQSLEMMMNILENMKLKHHCIRHQQRWDFCKNQSFKTVAPKFAMTQDGKVNRLTIPLGDGVILLTVELNCRC